MNQGDVFTVYFLCWQWLPSVSCSASLLDPLLFFWPGLRPGLPVLFLLDESPWLPVCSSVLPMGQQRDKEGGIAHRWSYHALVRLLDPDLWPMRSFSLDQVYDQACLWIVWWEIDPRCHHRHQWLWKSGMYGWSTTVSTYHSHFHPVDFVLCLFGLVSDQVCLGFSCSVKHFRCLRPLLHR